MRCSPVNDVAVKSVWEEGSDAIKAFAKEVKNKPKKENAQNGGKMYEKNIWTDQKTWSDFKI